MEETLEQIRVGFNDTANSIISRALLVPPHKGAYLTLSDGDDLKQLNAYIWYTYNEKSSPLFITATEFVEEIDLAPELSIQDAAKATRRFIRDLPDDIVDVDTGPGF